ncbi:ribosome 60S biogenesis N-terminal-domain-containing protein [Amylostereum chailletii]|nr:ribosome 60S biogenesis N-terminal-domain-containing protein [Amylostereum chailletii]
MPPKAPAREGEPPRKRAKVAEEGPGESRGTYVFKSADDLRRSLRQQNQEGLVEALTALRNQLTIKRNEVPISPQDERLLLLQGWLESSPGAQELFDIWSGVNQRQTPLLALIVSALASTVTLLSSHYTHHALGQPVVKMLLSSPWIQHLNSYLAVSHKDLIIATLKLFNALSTFAGGREQRALSDAFGWDTKSLTKLLFMRRKGNTTRLDILSMPDIRTLYILFLLSFVDTTSSASVKIAVLEQHREIFTSMFKGLAQDPYSLVRKILEVCWSGIWSDLKIKRTLKIGLIFGKLLAVGSLDVRAAPLVQVDCEHICFWIHLIPPGPRINVPATQQHFVPAYSATPVLLSRKYTPFRRHQTLALAKCLEKYARVLEVLNRVETALQEDPEHGQWGRRRRDLEREMRRRVPEFQVIIALAQKAGETSVVPSETQESTPNPTRAALLAESSTRLLWLYHKCLPTLVAEARFDVGKLLQNLVDVPQSVQDDDQRNPLSGLYVLRQLHILRLIQESDHFVWSGKTGSKSHIHILLHRYANTDVAAVRNAVESLLRHVLSSSILFQHDPDEVYLWLSALPQSIRSSDAEAPDGAALTNEKEAVVGFLDECIQRCMKTPYRYLEELQALAPPNNEADDALDIAASPLTMVVLEQLSAKVSGKLLPISDVLSVASFLRRLVVNLASKMHNLVPLVRIADTFAAALNKECLSHEHPVVSRAIIKEAEFLSACLGRLKDAVDSIPLPESTNPAVQQFLKDVEALPTPESSLSRQASAFELVDWIRLVEYPLHPTELRRLVQAIERFYKPAVSHIFEYIDPHQSPLQDPEFVSELDELQSLLPFRDLFIHSVPTQLLREEHRNLLARAALRAPRPRQGALSAFYLLGHRLASPHTSSIERKGLWLLMSDIVSYAKSTLSLGDMAALKEQISALPAVKHLCSSSLLDEPLRDGLVALLRALVDTASAKDKELVVSFSSLWAQTARSEMENVDTATLLLWIPYMDLNDVLALLDPTLANAPKDAGNGWMEVVEALVKAIRQGIAQADASMSMQSWLPQPISLYTRFPHLPDVENIIASAVKACLPLAVDGIPPSSVSSESRTMSSISTQGQARWSRRIDRRDWDANIDAFLSQTIWSEHSVAIVFGMVYLSSTARDSCRVFLLSDDVKQVSPSHLAEVIYALLDSVENIDSIHAAWQEHFKGISAVLFNETSSNPHRASCRRAVHAMMDHLPSLRSEFLVVLLSLIKTMSSKTSPADVVALSEALQHFPDEAEEVLSAILDHGLKWAPRYLAGSTDEDHAALARLGGIAAQRSPKAHLVDTVLSVSIQNRLADVTALEFVRSLLPGAQLKPLLVNRHLQSIIQHPQFYKHADTTSVSRDAVINLVHTLFHLHPTNTCQPTHIQPLIPAYTGSHSTADRKLLDIFRLYETTRKTSVAPMLVGWSNVDVGTGDARQSIMSLDSNQVFRSCLSFSPRRKQDDIVPPSMAQPPYDPAFVLSLCAQMLVECPPSTALEWVGLFRSNVVGLLIRTLSSEDVILRDLAFAQVAAISTLLQDADMQEKPHVQYIFGLLKDSIRRSPQDPATLPRLPSFTTLFLAHALRGVFYPANFIYPLTARFLLQRPELDTTDVPMLYGMLYSSSDEWKKERGWILKFLADAMLGAGMEEWNVFKRRRTWDLLAGIWQGGEKDRALRHGVLEVLVNLTCSRHIVTSLALKSALLAWMEMALVTPQGDLRTLWLKVIENVLMVADQDRLESATLGAWRAALGRCLGALICSDDTVGTLQTEARILLRLTQLPGTPVRNLPSLLSQLITRLSRFEHTVEFSLPAPQLASAAQDNRPHTSYSILKEAAPDVETWGEIVVALWRAAMSADGASEAWEALTPRVLVWRAAAGDRAGGGVGEWARREVVKKLGQ